MKFETVLTWQTHQWQQLMRSHQVDKLPHALLFLGDAGIGKKQFAKTLAYALMCLTPKKEGYACGECRTCLLNNANTHPDLFMLEPEEVGQQIKIDSVREVIQFVNETPLLGGYRIIIIDPANAMNNNAANALLKSLEEPSSHCLFILINSVGIKLLATIQSRCQKIIFQKPDEDTGLKWLQKRSSASTNDFTLALRLANGAPFKANDYLQNHFLSQRDDLYKGLKSLSQFEADPLKFANDWINTDINLVVTLMQNWLRDLLVYKLTNGEAELLNQDFIECYAKLTNKISFKNINAYINFLNETASRMKGPYNLNRQLVLEELFINWVKHVSN